MPGPLRFLIIAALAFFTTPVALAEQALDFLAGQWCHHSNGETVEEIWYPPAGSETLGMSRNLRSEKQVAFEYLRITVADGLATYIAQPGGRPPVAFVRTDGGDSWVRFENPKHDFPTRIEYRRAGKSLKATISGPGENGTEFSIPVEYHPCTAIRGVNQERIGNRSLP
jgi:hypothetical protein